MLESVLILRWSGWRRFALDFFVIQIGFFLFAISINIVVQADLGTGPWTVLEKGLADRLSISLGQASIAVAGVITLMDVLLRQPLGWGSVANMVFIGLWVDLLKTFIPAVGDSLWARIAYLLLGTFIMGFATAIYIRVNAGAGPRDSLMLAVSRVTKISLRLARGVIEIAVALLGWLLGGPLWFGTLIFAITIGPVVQLAFQVLKIRPSQQQQEIPGARQR
jgi:uncharacterized membrane protein YczE